MVLLLQAVVAAVLNHGIKVDLVVLLMMVERLYYQQVIDLRDLDQDLVVKIEKEFLDGIQRQERTKPTTTSLTQVQVQGTDGML